MTKENIGYVHEDLGDLAQARSYIEEAYSILLQSLGPELEHQNTMKAARALQSYWFDPRSSIFGVQNCVHSLHGFT